MPLNSVKTPIIKVIEIPLELNPHLQKSNTYLYGSICKLHSITNPYNVGMKVLTESTDRTGSFFYKFSQF